MEDDCYCWTLEKCGPREYGVEGSDEMNTPVGDPMTRLWLLVATTKQKSPIGLLQIILLDESQTSC